MKLTRHADIGGQAIFTDSTGQHWTRRPSWDFIQDDPDQEIVCNQCKKEIDLWADNTPRCSECDRACPYCEKEHGYIYLTTGKPKKTLCENCVEVKPDYDDVNQK